MRFRDLRTKWQALRGRRLLFEELERRDLLTVLRIVDYNTLNGPNNATDDANFRTVFQAIGNETVQGNTERIDILALQETDPPGSGDSIGRVRNILNGLYPTTTYASVVSSVVGGDSTGIVYDTSSVTLLESVEIGTGSITHPAMRAKFQPVGAPVSSIFYVYSIHLKSGDGSAEATTRGTDAAFLRNDANALGEGVQVLFVGDFNMKTSAETAYVNMTSPGADPAGQLQDVADAPGDWYNNPAFISLHSQDPRYNPATLHFGMDDRFDIQFASGEFFDGVGVDYVSNSFHVFGNNGTHTLDQAITTGTGASSTVLSALVAASDHLPAVADYQIIVSTPNVRITQTQGSTKVAEGGLYDTYQVVLDTVPTANVTVHVSPNSQVSIDGSADLVFTPANALTPQTVVVRAVDDLVDEGDHSGSIAHTSSSSDSAYNNLTIASVNVSIADNDPARVVINELDADQTGTDNKEFVELYDGGVGNVSLNNYVLVFFNGNLPGNPSYRAVRLSGVTDSNGFFVLGDSGLGSALDQQFANATNNIEQGPDGIGLYKFTNEEWLATPNPFPNGTSPTTSHLKDAVVYNTAAGDNYIDEDLRTALNPDQPQIDENQNGNGGAESLSRLPDGGAAFNTSLYVAQATTPSVSNQPVGVQIIQSASRVDLTEDGATDSYQLALLLIPTANVQIKITPDSQTDLGAGPGAFITLTFTPANALIPQTVNVSAVDDAVVEGNHTSVITHTLTSSDTRYNGLGVSNVIANIVDNDLPPPTSIVISELMYDPATEEVSPGVGEWIEIINTGTAATDLHNWLFDDEDATNWGPIPNGTILNPNQVAVFFDIDFTTAATFRSEWSVPATSLVVGIKWGNLSNSPKGPGDEVLKLLNNVGLQMDVVNYDDSSPWPTDLEGRSIYLKNLSADNNVGSNWARSVVGAARAVSPTGSTYSTSDVGSPGRFFLPGDYNKNAFVDAADYVLWRKTLGQPVTAGTGADGSGPTVGVPNGVVDQADYTYWRSNFGSIGAAGAAGNAPLPGDLPPADNLSSPLAVTSASSTSSEPEPTATALNESAVDSAMSAFIPSPPRPTQTTQPNSILQSASPQFASSSADLLLLAVRSEFVTHFGDDRSGTLHSTGDQPDAAVDRLFASLDANNLATEFGLLAVGQALA